MQNIVSKEWKAESARRYQAHLARRRKATVDANAASILNKPTPIVDRGWLRTRRDIAWFS